MVLTKHNQHQTLFACENQWKPHLWECLSHQTPHSPGRITGEMPGVCFGRRGRCLTMEHFIKWSVEYNYQKSFCIKYLLKFKYPTEVCQTIALIWTWKQFTEESWPQLFKRCGWHYPRDNWQLFLESEWVLRPHGLLTQRPERWEE